MMISPININTFCDYMHKLYLLDPLPLSVFMEVCVILGWGKDLCGSSRLSVPH